MYHIQYHTHPQVVTGNVSFKLSGTTPTEWSLIVLYLFSFHISTLVLTVAL